MGALFLVASDARAQPRLGDELVASPLVWRAFGPWVIALGDHDSARAVAYLRASDALLRKADGPIERDAPTLTFQTRALESIGDFDLKEFFALLPERDGPYRAFAFQGTPLARGYRFEVGKGTAFEVNRTSSRRGFGEASGVVRMRHVEANDKFRYLLLARGGVGIGPLAWPALTDGVVDFFGSLGERTDYETLPLLLQTADSHLKRSQPALNEEDRRVLASLWGSFPEVSRLLTSVSSIDDVLVGSPSASLTQLRVVTRWDLSRLARDYPHLAEFLRNFGKLVEGKLRLLDAHGNTLVEVFFDTEHMRSRIEAFVSAGKVVPSKSGKPLREVPADYRQLRAHVDMHMQQFGLHMYLDDLTMELTTEQHDTGARLAVQIKQTPRVRAEGAAFGVLPAGMLDWFIPGDIEGLARKMMDVTMKGNGGRGVTLNVDFERPASGLATLDGSAGLEILDTALIRFGMKIAAERVMPDEDATRDLARLTLAYRNALRSDVERYAKYGRLAGLGTDAARSPPTTEPKKP